MAKLTDEEKIVLDNKMVELWKSLGISYANFEFSCGGDCMGDTLLVFYDKDGDEISCGELENYFDNQIYESVNFYVDSNGHYQGESGNVRIELDNNDFNYYKTSESEYTESHQVIFNLKLNDEQTELINKYIRGFAGADTDGFNYIYKPDLLITDSEEAKLDKLKEFIEDAIDYYQPDTHDMEGELDGFYSYSTGEDGIGVLVENTLQIDISYDTRVFRDEND